MIDLHPGDSDLFGENDAFENGPNNQADNEDAKDENILNTPPSLRDEEITPPKPPPKTTRSPPKTSTRAPTWKYDVCVSFRRPKERITSRIPDSIITQFTIHRAVNAYRTPDFYKGLTNKARHNLLMQPPYSAWKDLKQDYIPKFDFATPMFKVALKDKSCHLFKAYPKEEELAQMPEPGIFLKNNIPDSEHVRFFVTFDCKISQRTILRAIKSESVVEVTDFTCQEDPSTPVRNLVQAADRAALLLTSQPTEAVSTWMAALPTYSRELAERRADLEAENTIQPSNCSPVIKVGTPATVPRRSTSDSPFHANNAGKLHRNFQVTIGRQGGRDVVVTPDTTSPPGIARSEEPPHQQAPQPIIKPVDTEQLMAPTTEVPPNLQPFIMQILAAQQQLHPKASAHERLGPVTPPPPKVKHPHNQPRRGRPQYFRRYNGPPRRRSYSPRSRSPRRNEHSRGRSPSPKRPREGYQPRGEESRRSPMRHRPQDVNTAYRPRESRPNHRDGRPQQEKDHPRRSSIERERTKNEMDDRGFEEFSHLLGLPARQVMETFRAVQQRRAPYI